MIDIKEKKIVVDVMLVMISVRRMLLHFPLILKDFGILGLT